MIITLTLTAIATYLFGKTLRKGDRLDSTYKGEIVRRDKDSILVRRLDRLKRKIRDLEKRGDR